VNVVDGRQPFETRLDAELASGSFSGSDGFTVPAGKRFVAEFIAVNVTLPPGQTPLVFANAHSGAVGFVIPLDLQGTHVSSVPTYNQFTGAHQILDFEAGGGFYDVTLARDPNSAGGNVDE
jgi:hypothetical protein